MPKRVSYFGIRRRSFLLQLMLLCCLLQLNAHAGQKNVWLGGAVFLLSDNDNTTKVFIDRYGFLYPQKKHGIYIPYSGFNNQKPKLDEYQIDDCCMKSDILGGDFLNSSLIKYFGYDGTHGEWEKLKQSYQYNEDANLNYLHNFFLLQEKMTKSIADEIIDKFTKSQANTLVLLIHGYNDVLPDFYSMIQKDVSANGNIKPYFIEVYWDGLTANNGNPAFKQIWGKAQFNTRFVGLRLRKMLSYLPNTYTIKVITHSLGASVANFAFFNAYNFAGKNPDNIIYTSFYSRYDTIVSKHHNVTLGMVAPAIPYTSYNTLTRNSDGYFPIRKILVCYNENDYALTKMKIFGANMLGNTSLGCNWKGSINELRQVLYMNQFDTNNYIPSNFTKHSNTRSNLEQHGYWYYMQRSGLYTAFLQRLLN